jgi:topoisomerase-4 subunit A
VVTLADLHSRNKAGKAALTVPQGASVIPAAAVGEAGSLLAAVSTDGRLLLFALEELPELARGKGNKILGLPAKSAVEMAAICVLAQDQALKIISGQRHMTLKPKDLDHYLASRGRRGSALPRGWRKVDRLIAE